MDLNPRKLVAKVAAPLLIAAFIGVSLPAGGAPASADQPLEPTAMGPGFQGREKPCLDVARVIPDQGYSCPVAGGIWKVQLKDGTSITTHGPDAPAATGRSGVLSPAVVARDPICVPSYDAGNRMKAIIAVPSDVTGDKTVEQFRNDIRLLNGIFFHAAVESGSPAGAHFRFSCAGGISVAVVRLPTSTLNDSFSTIVSDLQALGYNRANEKYVVHYDAGMGGGKCGQGTLDVDSRDSASNANNSGRDFAVNYDCDGTTLLHEIGHNLGAVQTDAPRSTGVTADRTNGWHCWEGWDFMCYNDGGNKDPGTITRNCPDFDHFDCNHDDYFDARIGVGQGGGPGSYLDTKWNIGECYVTWIVNGACDRTPPAVGAPTAAFTWPGSVNGCYATPADGVPTKIQWQGSDTFGIARYTLQQYSYATGIWSNVSLPTPTTTSVILQLPPNVTTQFRVSGQDNNGNWSPVNAGAPFTPRLSQENAATYSGSWFGNSSSECWPMSSGGDSSTSMAGATANFTFTGKTVALVASTGPGYGRARVYVDGTLIQIVDLHSPTTRWRQVVFFRNGLSPTSTHTLQVVAEGTAGRPWVNVDALAVIQ
jgi:hypothetical protein